MSETIENQPYTAQEATQELNKQIERKNLSRLQAILSFKEPQPNPEEMIALLRSIGLNNSNLEAPNDYHSGFRLHTESNTDRPSEWLPLDGKLSILSSAFKNGNGQGIHKIDFDGNGKIIHILADGKEPIFGSKFGEEAKNVTAEYGEETDLVLGKDEVYFQGSVISLSVYKKRIQK